MKKIIVILLVLLSAFEEVFAQDTTHIKFEVCHGIFARTSLGYRKANIEGDKTKDKALVIYLHGGSSCGTDNETQLNEAGIDSIANYLYTNNIPSVFVVPQCTSRATGWGGMTQAVKTLLDSTLISSNCDAKQIYIFGGSMGGTGTWTMLNNFPGYFAAAMPCAGNPSRCAAAKVAKTPIFTVMGTADSIMSIPTVETFLESYKAAGGDYQFETEEGWTHEITCIQSYTSRRLDWVFSHVKYDVNGDGCVDVGDITALINQILGDAGYNSNLCDINADGKVDVGDITKLNEIILNN